MADEKSKLTRKLAGDLWRAAVRLNRIVWRDRTLLLSGFAATIIISSVLPFANSGARSLLVEHLVRIAGNGVDRWFWTLLATVLGLFVLTSSVRILQGSFDRRFWLYMDGKFKLDHMLKMGELDIEHHESPKQNDLITRTKEQGTYRVQNYGERQFFLAENLIVLAVASGVLAWVDWRVFLLVLAGTLPELVTELRMGQEVWGLYDGKTETRRRFWNVARHFDMVNYVSELKLLQSTRNFWEKASALFNSFQVDQYDLERKRLWVRLLTNTLSEIVLWGAVVYFATKVANGSMQIGLFLFLLASIGDFQKSLSATFMNLARQYEDGLFTIDYFKLLDLKPVIRSPRRTFQLPSGTPVIEFRRVSFAYPGTDTLVLKDFSCRIAPGEKVAIVGINGAGKTTLVKLLARFYDPAKGSILVGGRDLREIDLQDWYSKLGVLFQNFANYRFLVKETIGVGRTAAPIDLPRVKVAAEDSEASDFIGQWKDSYDQMLGKQFTGGVEPSGGQWQKLALARTFYRDAHVLVLDEPTAALDPDAEETVFNRLENLPDDRSVILISHRFSTVRRADRILVIEKGRLSEEGTHKELLRLNGTYARMFRKQARGYM